MNSNIEDTEALAAECAELSYKAIIDKIKDREDSRECLYYASVLNVARVLTSDGRLAQEAVIHNLQAFVDDLGVVVKAHFSESDSKK